MIKVTEFAAHVPEAQPQLTVRLPFDERKKSRLKTVAESGEPLGFILPRGHILRDGTRLLDESGRLIEVKAANETVSTVSNDDLHKVMRAAYHLGNRHVPLQIGEGWLRYQHDHVLDDMVIGLGLDVMVELAPFEPEDGAYSGGHAHSHSHSHEHGHHHEH
ncbi:MAG: urease accessory protein UreE [Ketobacter sp.]|nr:urease accessory protein UreE [Ketobacter sp.]